MENRYGLYLSRDGTALRFPVNPESYKISRDSDNGTYNVLGVGPIMVPRTPKLQVITWSGLLPGRPEGTWSRRAVSSRRSSTSAF